MSVDPGAFNSSTTSTAPEEGPGGGWHRKLVILLFVLFSFEIGLFLLVFPWVEPWDNNWMADLVPWGGSLWSSPFFRGALSGLGFLNIYIALGEIFRLRRPS